MLPDMFEALSNSNRRSPPCHRAAFEFVECVGDVAADDDETVRGVDEDALVAGCVAWGRQQPDVGKHLRLAVVLDVGRTREIDPFGRVMGRLQFEPLDVDRHALQSARSFLPVEQPVMSDG